MADTFYDFGDYQISQLFDGRFEAPLDVLLHSRGEEARQQTLSKYGKPKIELDVNCYLLKGPDGYSLIDAGGGPEMGAQFGLVRTELERLGVAPSDIQRVLVTHMHVDHVRGLVDNGAPYFPNADITAPDTELEFFLNQETMHTVPEARRGGFKMTALVKAAYGEKLMPISKAGLPDGIKSVPLPGHTPGQNGYLFEGSDSSLLILGDVFHIAELQPGDPGVRMVFDFDPDTAAATRADTLAMAADKGWIIAGGHVGFSRIERDGDAYQVVSV